MFVISHRDPKFAEKKVFDKKTRRGKLNALLTRSSLQRKILNHLASSTKKSQTPSVTGATAIDRLDTHDYTKYDLFPLHSRRRDLVQRQYADADL